MEDIKFIPCSLCKDKEPLHKLGYYYVYDKDNTIIGIVECDCHKEYKKRKKTISLLKKSNLNILEEIELFENYLSHYKGQKSLPTIYKLRNYINNYHKNTPAYHANLYFYGGSGTQKTYASKYVGYHLIKKGFSVYYILMQSLIVLLSPDFNAENNTVNKLKDFLLSVDLLIIDDSFDKRKVTLYRSGYQLPFLESFLKERFDIRKKGTIFISTTYPTNIQDNGFGDSLQNFIVRNTLAKGTVLTFEDIYEKEISRIEDLSSIFS